MHFLKALRAAFFAVWQDNCSGKGSKVVSKAGEREADFDVDWTRADWLYCDALVKPQTLGVADEVLRDRV
jgi:hypothetical protein